MNPIRNAMKILASRGMAKYKLMDEEGRCCVEGALNYALTGDVRLYSEDRSLYFLISEVAHENYPERQRDATHYPCTFNNHPQTTLDEMLTMMDKAAVRLDEAI